jgi:hypothetical protein
VPGRNRIDSRVGSTVRASAVEQKRSHVLFIEPGYSGRVKGRRGWRYFADAYGVLQELSAPHADEHATWDTLRLVLYRAMPRQFETSLRYLEG